MRNINFEGNFPQKQQAVLFHKLWCLSVCAAVFVLACVERLHAKTRYHPCWRATSSDGDEKPAGARRDGDAKVVVSFNSPADTTSAIVFVFTKLQRKLASALSRRCCHVQPEAEKNKKGSRGEKSDELLLKRQKIRVSQAGGSRRMSVIRGGCRAPQLKLVHCSVELVRNYCSLYPALNLSSCSGSAPSCVRLFEVGKSCSHVLLMLSVSVSRSFSPVSTASPQK